MLAAEDLRMPDLLDPKLTDRKVRAFSFMATHFAGGAQTAIDCLIPFVTYAASQHAGQEYVPEQIQAFIKDRYSVKIPLYTLAEIDLQKLGFVNRHAQTGIKLCARGPMAQTNQSATPALDEERFEELESALSAYGLKRKLKNPVVSASWSDALVTFFVSRQEEIPQKRGNFKGIIISDQLSIDNSIIADFIVHVRLSNPRVYSLVELVFYGVCINDFLAEIGSKKSDLRFDGVNVFYDTTVLMRILGTSGTTLQRASLELHESLRSLGCSSHYFPHTYAELESNLKGIVTAFDSTSATKLYRETASAFHLKQISRKSIALLLTNADKELGASGITEYPITYSQRSKDKFQLDEVAFSGFLRKGSYTGQAVDHDVQATALIMRMRAGAKHFNFYNCKAMFITHNTHFTAKAKEFVVFVQKLQPRGAVSPVITVGQATTIGWIAGDNVYQSDKISKELIANCIEATLPSSGWEGAFEKFLASLRPEELKKLDANALKRAALRKVVLEDTYGNPALFKPLTLEEALKKSDEIAEVQLDEYYDKGRSDGIHDYESTLRSEQQAHAEYLGTKLASFTFWLILLASGAATIIFALPSLKGEKDSIVYGALSLLLALVTLFDFIGKGPRIPVHRLLKSGFVRVIQYIQSLLIPQTVGRAVRSPAKMN
jgi:hypothetical protein